MALALEELLKRCIFSNALGLSGPGSTVTPMSSNGHLDGAAPPVVVTDADRALAAAGQQSVERLRAELAEQRRLRVEAERAARNAEAARKAIVGLSRDRDALTSDGLDRTRATAERLLNRLEDAWAFADRLRFSAAELCRRGLDVTDPDIIPTSGFAAASDTETSTRAQVAQMLSDAGMAERVRVPAAPAATAPPDRKAAMAELLAETDAFQSQAQARHHKLTRGAGRDYNPGHGGH